MKTKTFDGNYGKDGSYGAVPVFLSGEDIVVCLLRQGLGALVHGPRRYLNAMDVVVLHLDQHPQKFQWN